MRIFVIFGLLLGVTVRIAQLRSITVSPTCSRHEDKLALGRCLRPFLDAWELLRQHESGSAHIVFPTLFYTRQQIITLCDFYLEAVDKCMSDEVLLSCRNSTLLNFARSQLGFICTQRHAIKFLASFDCVSGAFRQNPECREHIHGLPLPELQAGKCKNMAGFFTCLLRPIYERCSTDGLVTLIRAIQGFGCDTEELQIETHARISKKHVVAISVLDVDDLFVPDSQLNTKKILTLPHTTTRQPSTLAPTNTNSPDQQRDPTQKPVPTTTINLQDIQAAAKAKINEISLVEIQLTSEEKLLEDNEEEREDDQLIPVSAEKQLPHQVASDAESFLENEILVEGSGQEAEDVPLASVIQDVPKDIYLTDLASALSETFPAAKVLGPAGTTEDSPLNEVDSATTLNPDQSQSTSSARAITEPAEDVTREDIKQHAQTEPAEIATTTLFGLDVTTPAAPVPSSDNPEFAADINGGLLEQPTYSFKQTDDGSDTVILAVEEPVREILEELFASKVLNQPKVLEFLLQEGSGEGELENVEDLTTKPVVTKETTDHAEVIGDPTEVIASGVTATLPQVVTEAQDKVTEKSDSQTSVAAEEKTTAVNAEKSEVILSEEVDEEVSATTVVIPEEIQAEIAELLKDLNGTTEQPEKPPADKTEESEKPEVAFKLKEDPQSVLIRACTPAQTDQVTKCLTPLSDQWQAIRARHPSLNDYKFSLFRHDTQDLVNLCDIAEATFEDCLTGEIVQDCRNNIFMVFVRRQLGYACGEGQDQFFIDYDCLLDAHRSHGEKCMQGIRGLYIPGMPEEEKCSGVPEYFSCMEDVISKTCDPYALRTFLNAVQSFGCNIKGGLLHSGEINAESPVESLIEAPADTRVKEEEVVVEEKEADENLEQKGKEVDKANVEEVDSLNKEEDVQLEDADAKKEDQTVTVEQVDTKTGENEIEGEEVDAKKDEEQVKLVADSTKVTENYSEVSESDIQQKKAEVEEPKTTEEVAQTVEGEDVTVSLETTADAVIEKDVAVKEKKVKKGIPTDEIREEEGIPVVLPVEDLEETKETATLAQEEEPQESEEEAVFIPLKPGLTAEEVVVAEAVVSAVESLEKPEIVQGVKNIEKIQKINDAVQTPKLLDETPAKIKVKPVPPFQPVLSSLCTPEKQGEVRTCLLPLMEMWVGFREEKPELNNISFPMFKYQKQEILALCDDYANAFLNCDFSVFEICLGDEMVRFSTNNLGYICSPQNIQSFMRNFDCVSEQVKDSPQECLQLIHGPSLPGLDANRCTGINEFYQCVAPRIVEKCLPDALFEFEETIVQFGCSFDKLKE